MNELNAILVYCRAGFEQAAAEECVQVAKPLGIHFSISELVKDSGYVVLPAAKPITLDQIQHWNTRHLMFARQVFYTTAQPMQLNSKDRVTGPVAVLSALRIFAKGLGSVWVEYPDTNDGKSLSTLARAIEPLMVQALGTTLSGPPDKAPRGHVFLASKAHAWVGVALPALSCTWRLGITRLRMPSEAPSRSTLKLAEALMVLLDGREEEFLKPEMRAVDLGAAPGGWTWQLIHRGLHVTAVDNGVLKGDLRDNALVKHLREDGFRYRPKRPVEWLVCDMVEQPSRIATLVADWVATNTAQHAIFNLKLPMKKRLEEVARCQKIIDDRFSEAGVNYVLRIKQLYHDREEVTCFLTRHAKRF
jgi:23S rRNA (cytidine2498-2'-O)-methyltransferase